MVDEEWQGPPGLYIWMLVACCGLLYRRTLFPTTRWPKSFESFQLSFFVPFFLASLVYQQHDVLFGGILYAKQGLKKVEIANLLAILHCSAFLLGTVFGVAADSVGRKQACILLGIVHLTGCLSLLSKNYSVLCFAYVCLGVAASLFPCAFEAWSVCELDKRGFKQERLTVPFWFFTFISGVTGIVDFHSFGPTYSPILGGALAGLCALLVGTMWGENRAVPQVNISKAMFKAFQSLKDKNMLLLGLAQTSFEFSVVIFWLLWIPTMVADGRRVQLGSIYVQLMASMMLGSVMAAFLLSGPYFIRPEKFLPWVYLASALALSMAAYDYQEVGALVFIFCVFLVCVGIVLPSLAHLRNLYFPNDQRASLISICQMPKNAMLLLIYFKVAYLKPLENSTIFGLCVFALLLSAVGLIFLDPLKRIRSGKFTLSGFLQPASCTA